MFSNADCTLYHREYDRNTRADIWTRTVITDIYWEQTNGQKLVKDGWSPDCTAFISIPFQEIDIELQDIIIKGISEKEISTDYTLTDLQKEYKEKCVVISVDKYDFGDKPHFEIRGK